MCLIKQYTFMYDIAYTYIYVYRQFITNIKTVYKDSLTVAYSNIL